MVLVFSELSCNVCRDREVAFADELAAELPAGQVVAIVSASRRRYVFSFARVSGAQLPIYYDGANRFVKENTINAQPMLLLLADDGTVVAADYPIPGRPEWSEPFHDACRRLLMPLSSQGRS